MICLNAEVQHAARGVKQWYPLYDTIILMQNTIEIKDKKTLRN